MNIISEHGFRADGRRAHQMRNINCRLGVYSQAEGSAYIEQGNTKKYGRNVSEHLMATHTLEVFKKGDEVICAVYGPHEAKRSRQIEDKCVINCQYSMTTFSGLERKKRPRGDRRSNEFSRLLEKTFESAILTQSFPRSQIDIFCEVIQADGSHLSACVNAATLALADAGIPLRGLVAAVTCASIDAQPVVDINSREETDLHPRMTLATISGRDEVVLVELQNRLHIDHLSIITSAAKDAASNVHECLHAAIREHLEQCAALL